MDTALNKQKKITILRMDVPLLTSEWNAAGDDVRARIRDLVYGKKAKSFKRPS